jgi:hypothetical protein
VTPLTLPGGSGEEQPARLGYGRNSAARWPRSRRPRPGSRSSRSSSAPSAPRLRPRPGQAGVLAGPPRAPSCRPRCASLGCQRARRCRDRPASWHRGLGGTRPHRRPGSLRRPRDPGNHCLHPGDGALPWRRMRGQRAEAAASPASAGPGSLSASRSHGQFRGDEGQRLVQPDGTVRAGRCWPRAPEAILAGRAQRDGQTWDRCLPAGLPETRGASVLRLCERTFMCVLRKGKALHGWFSDGQAQR